MTLEEKAQKYTIDNVCGNCNKCQSKGYIGCDTFRFAKKAYLDSANEMKCYANCKKCDNDEFCWDKTQYIYNLDDNCCLSCDKWESKE